MKPSFAPDEILEVLKRAGHEATRTDGKDSWWFLCVFHEEKRASLHVTGGEKNVYKCFGCAASGGIVDLARHLEVPYETTGGRGRPRETIDPAEWKHWAEALWTADGTGALEVLHGRGFSDETLKRFSIGVTHKLEYFERGPSWRITIPIFDRDGLYRGARRYHPSGANWVPDFIAVQDEPQRIQRMRSAGDRKTFAAPCPATCGQEIRVQKSQTGKTIQCDGCGVQIIVHPLPAKILPSRGLKAHLYGAQALAALRPSTQDEESTVVVTEGEWDRVMLEQHGFHSVTGTAGAMTWSDDWTSLFDGLSVVILYDGDRAGRTGANSVREALQARGLCSRIRMPDWTFPDGSGWKDVCDWFGAAGRSADALQELIDMTESLDTGGLAASVREQGGVVAGGPTGADQIHEVRAAGRKMATHIKRQRIAEILQGDLESRGRFVRTEANEYYYFLDSARRLYRLFDEKWKAFVYAEYRLNATEPEYKFAEESLNAHVIRNGTLVDVRHLAHFDARSNQVYMSQFDGSVLRVGTAGSSVVANGTDGVLFLDSDRHAPWTTARWEPTLVEAAAEISLCVDDITFDGQAGVPVESQRKHFLLWVLCLFLGSEIPSKPLCVFLGPAGSGKSFAFKRLLWLLFGPRSDVTSIDGEDRDAFEAAVMGTALVVFDNVDSASKFMADALATMATGRELVKRKLYTTLEKMSFRPTCFVGITSRTPHYTRPDIVDRMLLFRVDRRPKGRFRSERALKPDDESRARFFTAVAVVLKSVLAAISEGLQPQDSDHRMADWATMAVVVARALGWEESHIRVLMEQMEEQRTEFLVEETDLVGNIERWLQDNAERYGQPYSTGSLAKELNILQDQNKERFRYNPRHLGKKLREVLHALRRRWEVEVTHKGRSTLYTFHKLTNGSAQTPFVIPPDDGGTPPTGRVPGEDDGDDSDTDNPREF